MPERVAPVGQVVVEHHRLDVGVVPQVGQLVAGVPVVGVDRNHRGLERGEHALQVLGAVVEVLGDLGLVAQAGAEQGSGDAVGSPVEVPPGDGAAAAGQRRSVGEALGDRLPDVGEVPAGRGHGRWRRRG